MGSSARFSEAFTLIELLVATAISLLILGVVIAGYSKFQEGRTLRMAREETKNILRLVRAKAIHGEKPDDCDDLLYYELGLNSNREIYWQAVCQSGKGEEDVLDFNDVELTSPDLPINFTALSGVVGKSAVIQITSDRGSSLSITVDSSGLIYTNE